MKHTFKKEYYNKAKTWHEISPIHKIFFLYEWPLNLIRDLTSPIPNEHMWSQKIAILNPICSSIFVLIVTGCKLCYKFLYFILNSHYN